MRNTKLIAGMTAIALFTAPMAALAAPVELSGTVTDRFDNRLVLETPDGSILVEMKTSEGPATAIGARVVVSGDLDGRTLREGELLSASQETGPTGATLPAELASLNLRDLRVETKSKGEREYRALLPDGSRFEAEYDAAGRLEEVKAGPRAALPRPFLDQILPRPVLERIASFNVDRIHEVEFDSDGEIEIKGHAGSSRIEMEIAANGEMIEFERKNAKGADRADNRGFDLPRSEIERIARDAGYDQIGRIETRRRHADVWAVNANDEPVRIRIDMTGEVTREERL